MSALSESQFGRVDDLTAHRAKKFNALLDMVQTPQEQLDAEPRTTPNPPVRRRNLRSV